MIDLGNFNPFKTFVENSVNTLKNVGEAFVDLAEGDFAGALGNAGEALENNPLTLNGAGLKAAGKLLSGDVAGAGAEFVEGFVNAGVLDDAAKLFGVENLGADIAAGLFGDAVRDPKSTAESMKYLAQLPPPRGNEVAPPHTPQRPSAYASGKRGGKGFDGEAKLPSADPAKIREAGGAGLSVIAAFQNEMAAIIEKFYPFISQLNGGEQFDVNPKEAAEARRAGKEAAKAEAKDRAKAKAKARVDELTAAKTDALDEAEEPLIPEQPKFESAVARLKPPIFFEDLLAAFMTDLVQAQQQELKGKMNELRELREKKNDLRDQLRGFDNEADEIGAGGAGGEGNGLGALGSMVGDLMSNPAVGAAAMALIPPPFNMAAGLIGPAFELLGGLSAGEGGAGGDELKSLSKDKRATESELDDVNDSFALLQEEIKEAVQRLQQMKETISNIMNVFHQTAMNTISNIR